MLREARTGAVLDMGVGERIQEINEKVEPMGFDSIRVWERCSHSAS